MCESLQSQYGGICWEYRRIFWGIFLEPLSKNFILLENYKGSADCSQKKFCNPKKIVYSKKEKGRNFSKKFLPQILQICKRTKKAMYFRTSLNYNKRITGLEPATSTLARLRSTK